MLTQQVYDLILIDLHLPDEEGLELIRQLKQQVPETPIVVITALQGETIAVAAILEGAQNCPNKSEDLCPARLSQLDPTYARNLLVRRIHYAIKRAELVRSLKTDPTQSVQVNTETEADIWDWDLKNNQIHFSWRWQSLLGIYGNPVGCDSSEWIARIHPQDRDRLKRSLQDYLDRQALDWQQQFYCEYRIQHVGGHYIWVLTAGKALRDQFGVAYRMIGSQSDITVRKDEEAAAYQRKEAASTALYAVGAGLLSAQAMLYIHEDRYEEAEHLLQGSLKMRKALLGSDHLEIAASLYNLASLYDNQFRFQEAEALFKESLSIFQKALGLEHPHVQRVQVKLTMICRLNQAVGLFTERAEDEDPQDESLKRKD